MLAITNPMPFADALKIAAARGVVLPDEYYSSAYTDIMRRNAFTISDMARIDQIQAVVDFLNKDVLAKGGTFYEFKKEAARKSWALPAYRLETVMRNHMQNAYQAGHWKSFRAHKERRPFLMYDSINDSRTRPSHRALDGVIKAVDDPFWATHSPPLGHNCRCSLRSLTREQTVARNGPTQGVPAEGNPDPGWGVHPLDGRESVLAREIDKKITRLPDPIKRKVRRARTKREIVEPIVPTPPPAPKLETLDDYIAAGSRVRAEIVRDQILPLVDDFEAVSRDVKRRFELGRKFQDAFMERLRKARPLGGKVNMGRTTPAAKQMMQRAADLLPADWVKRSNEYGLVRPKFQPGRGYHLRNGHAPHGMRYKGTKLDLGDSLVVFDSHGVAVHEFTHRLQQMVNGLDKPFQELHRRRTNHEQLQQLKILTNHNGYASDELAKPDKYVEPYMGREYSNKPPTERAAEVITMSMQALVGHDDYGLLWKILANDTELLDLTIGVLLHL